MLNDYIVENKEQIQKEVYDLCENQEIDYIFTLAKKGTFLFDIFLIIKMNCLLTRQVDLFVFILIES